ncbi:hypothetical protein JHK85_001726 [Glycine max]|nr:hypothetical protein JHK85_001726 [Glycine max]
MQPQVVPFAKQQKASSTGEDASHQLHHAIYDQLYKTVELIEAGNLNVLAFTPISSIFKIGAYKSFSKISYVVQFANFTSNQPVFEAMEMFDQIHIIDFDIGLGVQWYSLMQVLALRSNGVPSLKVTAIVSPLTCDEFEINIAQEELNQSTKDINMSFELNVLRIESLNTHLCPLSVQFYDNEAIVVYMPLSFHAHHCYSTLLESLDVANLNLDVLQNIENHFILPTIKKIILSPLGLQEKLPTWRNMFLQYGFSPFPFSNFTEAQAEGLVEKEPVKGFQLERKLSPLLYASRGKNSTQFQLRDAE